MKKSSLHQKGDVEFFIRENSWIARIAAWKLHSADVAITIGKTIHLWNVDAATFLKDEKWLRHEFCHIRQFNRFGFCNFIYRYLLESIKKGYYQNKYEVEARLSEEQG